MMAPIFSRGLRAGLSLLLATLIVTACGGGGGGSGGSSSGSGSGGGTTPPPVLNNTVPLVVDLGPNKDSANGLFASVTICVPGTTDCRTIDHILVDTGSTGLRILKSVISPALSLPQQTVSSNGLMACAQFVDGYTWGPVHLADVKLGGETASNLPINLIGSPGDTPAAPASCSSSTPVENTVATLGANGVLGVGNFIQDCGAACVTQAITGTYYTCTGSSCTATAVPLAKQLINPVTQFATDNNGVVIDMPAVAEAGTATVSGTLIFGIGTQANNGLGSASIFTLDNVGYFTTTYNGAAYARSYVDSGSNGYFFNDRGIGACTQSGYSGWYCPTSTQNLVASVKGTTGASSQVNFSVANTYNLFNNNPTYSAFSNLAGTASSAYFAWGMPFFYGRKVFTAVEGKSTPGGAGPYVAF